MPPRPGSEELVSRQRWHLLRSELRWAYRGAASPRYCKFWVDVPHTSAWLVLKGHASVRTAAGLCEAGPGEWLIAPPGRRWQEVSADCAILSVGFVLQWVFGRDLFPLGPGLRLSGREAPGLKAAALRIATAAERLSPGARHELPRRDGTISAHLRLQEAFDAWLARFAATMGRCGVTPCIGNMDARVEAAVKMLDDPGEAWPAARELARRTGVGASQLNRLFVRELGTTVREYCERRKLAAARGFLIASDLSVKETAFRLGFRSPQHFSRWFRARAGLSPSSLRRNGDPVI